MTSPLRFTVAFDDADGENIVFFANYFRLAHRAFEAWLPTIGITWSEWFASDVYGAPLIHAEADFLGSLKPGQVFLVKIGLGRLGETSVHFEYEFTNENGRSLARLKTSHAFVSRAGTGKVPIPAPLRAKLAVI